MWINEATDVAQSDLDQKGGLRVDKSVMPLRSRVLAITSGYLRHKDDLFYQNDFVVELVRRMNKTSEMHVLAPRDKGNRSREELDGVLVHRHNQSPFNLITIAYGSGAIPNLKVHPWKIIALPFFMLSLLFRTLWIVLRYRIDTVHLHWLIPHGLVVAILKATIFGNLKIVGTAYGADILQDQFSVGGRILNRVLKFIMSHCDEIATCSQNNKKTLLSIMPGANIRVIPVGVDTETFTPAKRSDENRRKYGIHGTSVLYVGSLIERKGVDALVAAIPAIIKDIPDFQLYIVGQGYLEKRLKDMVRTQGTESHVHFLGYVEQETKTELFANCDFFCLPSRSEGFGIVNTEAMASGCVPIVSALPVFEDVIEDRRSGFVLKSEDPAEFARVFKLAAQEMPQGSSVRQQIREKIIKDFSWTHVTAEYSALMIPKGQSLQMEFAAHSDVAFDIEARIKKGEKVAAVLEHYYKGKTDNLNVLDVGCSTGAIAYVLAKRDFHSVLALDIDEKAVVFAKERFSHPKLEYRIGNAIALDIPDASYDIVICAHIYEHVPDAKLMMKEIRRVLKPKGVCYFAAGNRFELMEPHYHLPLLSVLPKALGHIYIRLAGKAQYYYETHMSVWGLKHLVREFERLDYTTKIIEQPSEFAASDVIRPGSTKHRIAKLLSRFAYWLIPDYIWVLRKN